MPSSMFDSTIDALSNALSVYQRRHQVIASNIANVETPGYRAKDVDFQRALKDAFDDGDESARVARSREPAPIIDDLAAPQRTDGNTVDIDLQMAKLSANTGRYDVLAKVLAKQFGLLRQAIDGVR